MANLPGEDICLAWLAAASVKADCLQDIMSTYRTGQSVLDAFLRQDEYLLKLLTDHNLNHLKKTADDLYFSKAGALFKRWGIRTMKAGDPDFPDILTRINDPVSILFYLGNPACLQERVLGMFGSRAASYTGRKAARGIARGLSSRGVCIASGFAYGIDTEAHTGCIEGGSPTIAVMGGGLDQTYPAGNETLRRQLLDGGGLLLSEYGPGIKPLGPHFPYRNRITSALSGALILIEARIRSGSMTMVRHALDQGKELFVFPGDPGSPYFEGNHTLLREGARYFLTADDILEDMGWLDNPVKDVQNIDCSVPPAAANETEKQILRALEAGPLGFETIASVTGFPAHELMGALTMMQIRGAVEALPGKIYQIRRI